MTEKEIPDGKAPCDPGWNDPPLFSYDTHQAQLQTAKRANLTKRVVHPLAPQNNVIEKIPSQPPINPLLPCPPKPSETVTTKLQEGTPSTEGVTDIEEIPLREVQDNFDHILLETYGEGKEKQSADVKRRLNILETMWQEDKFKSDIKDKIFKLSSALREGDLDKADSIQKSLMVDYSSVCSAWMSGVRHILNTKRTRGEKT